LADRLSDRHGYRSADAEILVHEDAPVNLCYVIPLIAQDVGTSPSAKLEGQGLVYRYPAEWYSPPQAFF